MLQHQYDLLLASKRQSAQPWEEYPAKNYNIASLDAEEIFRAVKEGVNVKRLPPSVLNETVEDTLKRLQKERCVMI